MADMIEQATKPQSASDDAGSVTMPSITEKIKAEQFEAARAAKSGSTSVWAGCRQAKAKMPPATNDAE